MKALNVTFLLLTLLALVTGGCAPQPPAKAQAQAQAEFDVTFTLKSTMIDGGMAYVGVGGEIDGAINPDLAAQPGDRMRVTLINDDGMPHDFAVPDLSVQTTMVTTKGQTTDLVFDTRDTGEFAYYCTVSGHRQAGMEGRLIVSKP